MRPAGRTSIGRGGCVTRCALGVGSMWLAAGAGLSPADAHTVCGVLDHRPCTPTFCSVFDGRPCMPDQPFAFGHDLPLPIQVPDRPLTRPTRPPAVLNTLQELYSAMEACWQPPPPDQARPGTEITIRFSLTRDGQILGEPRFIYSSPSLPAEMKAAYQRSIAEMLKRCTPFALSSGLGGAIAGRPLSTRFIDDRGMRRTENKHE